MSGEQAVAMTLNEMDREIGRLAHDCQCMGLSVERYIRQGGREPEKYRRLQALCDEVIFRTTPGPLPPHLAHIEARWRTGHSAMEEEHEW